MLKRLITDKVNYQECSIQPNNVDQRCLFKETTRDVLTIICQKVFLNFSSDQSTIESFSARDFANLALVCQTLYYLSHRVFKDNFPLLIDKENWLIKTCRIGHAHLLQYLLTNPKLLLSENCLTRLVDSIAFSRDTRQSYILKILIKRFDINLKAVQLSLMVERHSIETIKILLEEGEINSVNIKDLFSTACIHGRKDIIDTLIEKGFDAFPKYPISLACYSNNIELIESLLKSFDPSAYDNNHSPAICVASTCGYTEIVRLLLKDRRVNPAAKNNQAIQWASHHGHIEVIKLLLSDPRVDPSEDDNNALKRAMLKDRLAAVRLLAKDKRVGIISTLDFALRVKNTKFAATLLKTFFVERAPKILIKIVSVAIPIFLINKLSK